VTIQISGTLTNISCALGFRATRTWHAVDAHGNSADCSQTVSIAAPTAVTMTCAANKRSSMATRGVSTRPPQPRTTAAIPVVSVSGTITNAAASSNQVLSVTRSWKAVDSCGNTAVCAQTVLVVDTHAAIAYLRPPTLWSAAALHGVLVTPLAFDPVDGTNVTIQNQRDPDQYFLRAGIPGHPQLACRGCPWKFRRLQPDRLHRSSDGRGHDVRHE